MINEILPRITTRLDRVESTGVSCHVHAIAFSSIESELCLGKGYVQKIPDDYPSGVVEKRGFRKLREPANALYQNIKLRIGISTLHIADRETKKNLEAISLFYFGNVESIKIGSVGAHKVAAISGVYLLENGAVASLYGIADLVALCSSWYPEKKEDYGGYPYPRSSDDVKQVLERAAQSSGIFPMEITRTNEFRVLPDLVMFCVEGYKGR